MSNPDLQYFASSGTWVKPPGAVRVDIVLQGVVGKFGGAHLGLLINPNGYGGFDGEPGEIRASSFDAAELPDAVEVDVGKSSWPGVGEGSMPDGSDGYALIVTHLADKEGEQQ